MFFKAKEMPRMTRRGFNFQTCNCQRKHNFLAFTQFILQHTLKLQCLITASVYVLKYLHAEAKYVQEEMHHSFCMHIIENCNKMP